MWVWRQNFRQEKSSVTTALYTLSRPARFLCLPCFQCFLCFIMFLRHVLMFLYLLQRNSIIYKRLQNKKIHPQCRKSDTPHNLACKLLFTPRCCKSDTPRQPTCKQLFTPRCCKSDTPHQLSCKQPFTPQCCKSDTPHQLSCKQPFTPPVSQI